jgi:hypothetical protein
VLLVGYCYGIRSTFSKNRHGRFSESDVFRRLFEEVVARCIDANTWGAATDVQPKFISESDPAAQWTAAKDGPAIFVYSDSYLIDLRSAVILDVEASRSVRRPEVGPAKIMIERTAQRFDLKPDRLAADTAYGSAEMLNWLAEERKIAPHVPVIDSRRVTTGPLPGRTSTTTRWPMLMSVRAANP